MLIQFDPIQCRYLDRFRPNGPNLTPPKYTPETGVFFFFHCCFLKKKKNYNFQILDYKERKYIVFFSLCCRGLSWTVRKSTYCLPLRFRTLVDLCKTEFRLSIGEDSRTLQFFLFWTLQITLMFDYSFFSFFSPWRMIFVAIGNYNRSHISFPNCSVIGVLNPTCYEQVASGEL